jgi:hypothetical protein
MRTELRSEADAGPLPSHQLALLFAREAGVEPEISQWPGLARALLFGPLTAVSFRLSGPDALPGVAWDVMTEAGRSGAITGPVLTDVEKARLAKLVSEGGRADLAWLLGGARGVQQERRAA